MFELNNIDYSLDELEIIKLIQKKVKEAVENDFQSLINFMYSFDLDESLMMPYLESNDYLSVARAIWNRQKLKMVNWK